MQGSALLAEVAGPRSGAVCPAGPAGGGQMGCCPCCFTRWRGPVSDELFVPECPAGALLAAAHPVDGAPWRWCLSGGHDAGESHYRHQLEVDIAVSRRVDGALLITIGMTMDWTLVADAWWQVLACVTGLILCKSLLMLLAGRLMGSASATWPPASVLSQVGSSASLLALASHHGLLDHQPVSLLIGIGVISIALTPRLVLRALGLRPLPHRCVPCSPVRGGPVGPEQNTSTSSSPGSAHRANPARFSQAQEILSGPGSGSRAGERGCWRGAGGVRRCQSGATSCWLPVCCGRGW